MIRARAIWVFALIGTVLGMHLLGIVSHGDGSKAAEQNDSRIFLRPGIAELEREIQVLIQAGRNAEALRRAEWIIKTDDTYAPVHTTKALIELQMGNAAAATTELIEAWQLGDRRLPQLVQHPPFDRIRDNPEIREILDTAEAESAPEPNGDAAVPAIVKKGQALVSAQNTVWDPAQQRLVSRFRFPDRLRTKPVMTGKDPLAIHLRKLVQSGRAAGLAGDLYDNRDRRHVALRATKFPQLVHVVYDEPAKAANLEFGYNGAFLFDAITLGNSSTAIKDRQRWRSQPRKAMTEPNGIRALVQSYGANQVYLFPEHRDHDPIADGGQGDVFPANTPYALISQGSSGSERKMMEAVAVILAGLPRDTKAKLKEQGLIAPAVQQIFRRGQAGIETDDDYLSPRAHPTVFDAANTDARRMLDLAQTWQADSFPGAVKLKVISESAGTVAFGDGLSERLFDTPGAIARVHRRLESRREMTISAAETEDPNGRPLSFRWVLLRGDPTRVSIQPEGPDGGSARIEIGWHERRPADSTPSITSDRVDFGVFAFNGVHWSAPAFVSVMFPADQRRAYDAAGQLVSLDFTDDEYAKRYTDPAIVPERDWRDRFAYDATGRAIGWTRTRKGGEEAFTSHGLLVRERDDQNRPLIAELVSYPLSHADGKAPVVVETPTGKLARYTYRNAQDLIGKPTLITAGE
ncbi:hypothetical protein KHP62_05570 [Rhodobacteraceae bacterium NNCM2]|nr:hypothetical protein [Coraliihabitans acroporae]